MILVTTIVVLVTRFWSQGFWIQESWFWSQGWPPATTAQVTVNSRCVSHCHSLGRSHGILSTRSLQSLVTWSSPSRAFNEFQGRHENYRILATTFGNSFWVFVGIFWCSLSSQWDQKVKVYIELAFWPSLVSFLTGLDFNCTKLTFEQDRVKEKSI